MPTMISGYAAPSAGAPLTKTTVERRDVRPHDVAIDIKFAGICHSDLHTVSGEWGDVSYPLVPGHEIAGVVTAIGPEVTVFQVGDRVGVGCMVGSCGQCDYCEKGEEQYCTRGMILTYNGTDHDGTVTQGGYSESIIVDEKFVLRLPDSIPLDKAAPLLCAGVTLWSPLKHWNAGPGTKIAILGLGGLGHVGVKLASALGAEVTVLSQSLKKMEDGLRFGAQQYFATSDSETFEKLGGTFDLILNTVSAHLNLGKYLELLKVDGVLVELGAPERPVEVPFFPLSGGRRSVSGSMIGSIAETQTMLNFCADHAIVPEIEVIDAAHINEAYKRLLSSDVRYRFVIDTSTI